MQILANALPGFRDLRAPAVAGYLWLLFAWLLLRPNVHAEPTRGVGRAAWDLADGAGHIGIVVAASVAAYFVGAVSQAATDLLRRFMPGRFGEIGRAHRETPPGDRQQDVDWSTFLRDPRVRRAAEQANAQIRDLIDQSSRHQPNMEIPVLDRLFPFIEELQDQAERTDREAWREINLPATLLVGERPELFAEVDRLRAEGELRLAASLPGAALAVLLASTASVFWLVALVGVVILWFQGLGRQSDSRKVIADAMEFGRVDSSAVRRFEQWIPDLLDRTRAAASDFDPNLLSVSD